MIMKCKECKHLVHDKNLLIKYCNKRGCVVPDVDIMPVWCNGRFEIRKK